MTPKEIKRAYTEIDPFIRKQLKIKAATEGTSIKDLLEYAVLFTYDDIKKEKEATNAEV